MLDEKSIFRSSAPKEEDQPSPDSYDIPGIFGRSLKQMRLEKGMTQEKLAEEAGVFVDTVKRYESGKYEGIRLDKAWCMANALGTSLQALLPKKSLPPKELLCEAETLIRTARDQYENEKNLR